MTSITQDPGSGLRTAVTRIHATCLFVITIATTTASTIGWQGHGPLRLLASQPLGYIGLYQAYLLMFLLAKVSLIGAMRWPSRLWNATLLAAHLAPASIIIIANDVRIDQHPQHGLPRRPDHPHSADVVGGVRPALEGALSAAAGCYVRLARQWQATPVIA